MGRAIVWTSAIIVAVGGLAGVLIPIANLFQAFSLFETGDPQLLASALSEWMVNFVLAAPFVLAQIFLAMWAIKQLRKQNTQAASSTLVTE